MPSLIFKAESYRYQTDKTHEESETQQTKLFDVVQCGLAVDIHHIIYQNLPDQVYLHPLRAIKKIAVT